MKNLFALFVMFVGLCGCQRDTTDLTHEQRASIAREVNQLVTSIYTLSADKDLRIYGNFSDSTTGIFSGTVMSSWEEHKRQMADFFSAQDKIESKIEILDTDVLAANAVLVVARYKMTATDQEGITYSSPTNCITYVFHKEKGQWKIVHFHDSEPK